MIRGIVNDRSETVDRLRLRGSGGSALVVDAIIDAGFTGSLTLPASIVASLGLERQSGGVAYLADESPCDFTTYLANLDWDDRRLPVIVYALGREALIGLGLRSGHDLRIEVEPGGAVEIAPRP